MATVSIGGEPQLTVNGLGLAPCVGHSGAVLPVKEVWF